MGYVRPFSPIQEGGLTELVGVDEKVDTSDYSGSVSFTIGAGPASERPVSGEILSFAFYSTEDGSGAVQTPPGRLIVLDADPAVASGDTSLAAAEWPTVIAQVQVLSGDWLTDAAGGIAFIFDTPVPFHDLVTLYFVWFHEDATSLNSDAADNEQLEFNFWYRRDS